MQKLLFQKRLLGTGGSRLGLSKDDKITVEHLLYGLLLVSGNDAAVALAEYIGGSIDEFSNLMNQKAASLGLSSTHFTSPHGLDHDEHYTTAYELALITDYALKNDTFSKIVKTKNHTVNINGHPKELSNTNELLGYIDGVYGVKTGFTNGANRCLVSACNRNNIDIICIVLGCDTKKDRTSDSIELINYIYDNFTLVSLKELLKNKFCIWKEETINTFSINKGLDQVPNIFLDETQIPFDNIALDKKRLDKIDISFSYNSFFEAPLLENTCIGYASIKISPTLEYRIPLLNMKSIKRKNIFYYIKYLYKSFTFLDKNDILINR